MTQSSRAIDNAGFIGRAWPPIKGVLYPEWVFNRRVRTTKAGFAYLAVVFAVAVAAFNTGNNMLYLVMAMLLGAIVASFMVSEYMIRHLEIKRSAPSVVTKGVEFSAFYEVENKRSLIPTLSLLIAEKLDESDVETVLAYQSGKETTKVRAPARAPRRGRLHFSETIITTSAPFGWFRKSKKIPLKGSLISLPSTASTEVDLEMILSRGEQKPINRPGRGDELFGFRGYVRGDPLHDIHWKITARVGDLTVRQRETETERRLRVVVDVPAERPVPDDLSREARIEKAASIAHVAIDMDWLVRVEAAGRGVDFGAGPAHLQTILYFLAMFDDRDKPEGRPLAKTDAEALLV